MALPQEPTRLPTEILRVIDAGSLCYLSTISPAYPGPHLSAMNFSLQFDALLGHILVMSTRRNTLKFEAMTRNNNVAVLLHDFDGRRQESATTVPSATHGTLAVTIYGKALLQEGDVAARMRAEHLRRNVAYAHFIADATEYAVFAVVPTSVLCCDIHDRVFTWQAEGQAPPSPPLLPLSPEGGESDAKTGVPTDGAATEARGGEEGHRGAAGQPNHAL
jgi:hypothetical protein